MDLGNLYFGLYFMKDSCVSLYFISSLINSNFHKNIGLFIKKKINKTFENSMKKGRDSF